MELSTRQSYIYVINRYLLPEFRALRMIEIMPGTVRDFVRKLQNDGASPYTVDKTRTILVAITQFALGCLLSGFCVFYIRSASITSSWPFLLAMAAIFIGNEYMRRYHARLRSARPWRRA